jgi:predicted nuclease of predicted toxin-antitoxin system
MKVLLDESLPRELADLLARHAVVTVQQQGWRSKSNGELLRLAELEFDVFLTADQNLEYQQNVGRFRIGVVVLSASRNRIESYLPVVAEIAAAVERVQPGTVVRIAA